MKIVLLGLKWCVASTVVLVSTLTFAAIVIDTPFGQFNCTGGRSACTMIDVYAANRFLDQETDRWKQYTPVQLTSLVRCGVERYGEALAQIQEDKGGALARNVLQFQACGAAPFFSKLAQLDVVDVAPFLSPMVKELQATGTSVVVKEQLLETINQFDGLPTCGVWTNSRGYSYLICYKDYSWLFFDSHYKSDGSAGASLRVFDSDEEFRAFVDENPAFKLRAEDTANLTLFAKMVMGE